MAFLPFFLFYHDHASLSMAAFFWDFYETAVENTGTTLAIFHASLSMAAFFWDFYETAVNSSPVQQSQAQIV